MVYPVFSILKRCIWGVTVAVVKMLLYGVMYILPQYKIDSTFLETIEIAVILELKFGDLIKVLFLLMLSF